MLKRKPILKYSGITLVLQNQSRFDTQNGTLLSGTGGTLANELLQPEFNLMQCEIRLADDESPLIEGTKVVVLLGEYAMHKYLFECRNNALGEMRGSPFYTKQGIPAICSFYPQDAADKFNLEGQYNEASHDYTGEEEDDEAGDEDSNKRFAPTKRSNYGFWLRQDIKKAKGILRQENGKWPKEAEPEFRLFPSGDEVCQVLKSHKGEFLELDIETDYEEQNIQCISFSFWDGKSDKLSCPIYGVPILTYEYKYAYHNLFRIIAAFASGIENNTLVCHNGHGFDFLLFPLKYHIPIYKLYDTLVAQRRIYPDIESSLGHMTSLWAHQIFHKDTAAFAYRTREHMLDHLKYCCRDVFTMWLGHKAQQQFATTIPGLADSIECGNRSLRPYLISTLQGVRYDEQKVEELKKENDLLMMQYLRIIEMLMGPFAVSETKKAVKKASGAICKSNPRLCHYFHDQLEYPVVARSGKTNSPSLGKKALYRLALKHDNPVITFINLYRQVAQEYGALKFHPFKDNNNKLIKYGQTTTNQITEASS